MGHNAVDAQMSMLLTRVQDTPSRFQLHECGDARLMRQPAPMLLGRAKDLFDQPDWSYEPKWGGSRVLAAKISR